MPAKIEIPNVNDIVSRYVAGESENKLALEIGVSRQVVRNALIKSGVHIRNQSESETIKWAGMSDAQRAEQVRAAHIAGKGRVVSIVERVARAIANQFRTDNISIAETILTAHLTSRGIVAIQQKAVHIYNIDISIEKPRVAVEIFGGGWHSSGDHAARFFERTKYLLDNGWNVIIVWVDGLKYPLDVACADYIITAMKEFSRNKSERGQYRVILGNGQLAPACKSKFNSPADVERLTSTD